MADLHNLGSYNTLEEVWKLLPYGGCPGDYVYIAGEQIYWNEYRSVWGNPDAAVSTDPEQTINGDLTVTKDLTVGEHTLGDTAKYNSLEVDNITINSNPFADKNHDHDLTYSKIGHVHNYAPKSHRHNVSDIDGLGEVQGGGNVDIVTDYDTDIPSNSNVPSMLRLLKELAENNEILTEYFIRKDKPDTAQGLITFLQGLKTLGNLYIGTFIGGLAGSGGRITPQGHAEMRSLRLWESLEVPELRYNRVEVIAGTSWRSQGGGIIESVTMQPDNINGTATLKLEEGDIGRVALDDLCMGIWHYADGNDTDNHDDSMGNFRFAGFGTSYFRITAVRGANNNEFDFTMRPISERYTKHYLPQPGMHFAQRGNPTLTERQKITYETPAYVRLLVGVTTWEYSQSNISMQFGDLSNLSVFGINVDALGSLYANHVVMTGVIDQSASVPDRIEFSWSNGSSVSLNGATDVTALIYNTWTDVTSSYDTFTWTRDSGHPQDDAAWNATHVNHGNVLTLTWADLPAERVLFTVTADKPGEMIEGQIVIV